MRGVFPLFIIMCMLFLSGQVFAKPGDTYNAATSQKIKPKSTIPTIMKRRARFTDIPQAPSGFRTVQLSERLGNVTALANFEHDLFVLDSDKGRVLRLRDRDKNGDFEIRSEFLVGFNQASSLAINDTYLFIADADGVWQIKLGKSLAASTRPKNILPLSPDSYAPSPRPLVLSPDNNLLYVGLINTKAKEGQIIAIDLRSRKPSIYASGNWTSYALAANISGHIIAAVKQNGTSFITQIKNGRADIENGLPLARGTQALDILFWDAETYNKNWPQIWKQDLIMAVSGFEPMIARAHYSFGGILPEYTSMIGGFSQASIVQNRFKVWGQPSALAILPNGNFIFAEQNGGTLWRLEKKPAILPQTIVPQAILPQLDEDEIVEPKSKTSHPALPSGSTMVGSTMKGSGIEKASLIGKDDLLTGKPQETKQNGTEKTPKKSEKK